MNTNKLIVGNIYKTSGRGRYFIPARRKNGEWVDNQDSSSDEYMDEVEIQSGTPLLVLAQPENALCSVALVGEQPVWVFDDEVDEL